MPELTGKDLAYIDARMRELFAPGERLEMIMGINQPLNADNAQVIQQELQRGGLQAQVEAGSTDEWNNALRIRFKRPEMKPGVRFLPLGAVLLGVLGLGGIAAGSIVGWKVGNVLDSLAKNLVPLAAIAGGVVIVWSIANSKRPVSAGR